MSEDMNQSERGMRRHFHFLFPKLLTGLIGIGLFMAINLNISASGFTTQTDTTITAMNHMQTLANVWFIAAIISILLLIGYYNGKYSIFWAKSIESKLDEREKEVRNRVFLRAYRWFFAVLMLGLGGVLRNPNQRVQLYAMNAMVLLLVALPSMIASFHKNAR